MFVLGWGALLRTKCWRIFPEAALSVNSAHTSVSRGCFSSSMVFASQLGDTAHKLKFRLPLIIALVPLFFLNTFIFCYRINLSEEQTIDIAMIEQLREAVDLLQDPNRYAYDG